MVGGSAWRAERNEKALARLEESLRGAFPAAVLNHALAQPLVPTTPRRAVESYWRHHALRADRLARGLARLSGSPEGWRWQLGTDKASGLGPSFRVPPAPFRERAFAKGAGHCCICGQPVFRLGWHKDLWGEGQVNRNCGWHAACVQAWKLWTAPANHLRALKAMQGRRCGVSGTRLAKGAEVDHRTPLFRVWLEHRDHPWPDLLRFWGLPNLQVINRAAHAAKSARECGERAGPRRGSAALTTAPRHGAKCFVGSTGDSAICETLETWIG